MRPPIIVDASGRNATIRVLHTIASTRQDHGGTSRSVPALCNALAKRDVEVALHTTVAAGGENAVCPILPGLPVRSVLVPTDVNSILDRLTIIPRFAESLGREITAWRPDVLHDHGAWLHTNWTAARAADRHRADGHRVPLVISPRGMLTRWSMRYHSVRKQAAWLVYQHRALLRATVLHATSQAEANELRELGLRQPVAIIPNGLDLPTGPDPSTRGRPALRALFFSRVHPKKGLLNLVDAWAQVRPAGWELAIVGPDDGGHRVEVERRIAEMGVTGVVFTGQVNDGDKWKVYRSADLFVLPTFSENFGIVVAEALAAGLPVITTRSAPWKDLETHRCGWWIDVGTEPLAAALREATELTHEAREAMGARGRDWVTATFSWERMAEQIHEVYAWILERGSPPVCVQCS